MIVTTNGVVDNKCGTSGGGIPGDAKSLGTGENVESRMLPPTRIQWVLMYIIPLAEEAIETNYT
jgi:hypothetical protein